MVKHKRKVLIGSTFFIYFGSNIRSQYLFTSRYRPRSGVNKKKEDEKKRKENDTMKHTPTDYANLYLFFNLLATIN